MNITVYVGSLFSGIGGIELGFEREGFRTAWFVEKDPYCQAVLRKNFKGVPIYDDVTTVQWEKLSKVSVVTGGFPCQDISNAGKRKGITGERSSLWKYDLHAIRVLRPKYAVIENVSALSIRGLSVVLADLAEIGYDAEWFTLRASDFGAIHRRERIFIIAYCSCQRLNPIQQQEKDGQLQDNKERNIQEIQQEWIQLKHRTKQTCNIVTNDWSQRIQGFRQESLQGKQGFSWCQNVRRIEELRNRQDIPEPLFCGSRDGVPFWVDRIRAIGNSVVPQVAQFIARQIKQKEEGWVGECNQ